MQLALYQIVLIAVFAVALGLSLVLCLLCDCCPLYRCGRAQWREEVGGPTRAPDTFVSTITGLPVKVSKSMSVKQSAYSQLKVDIPQRRPSFIDEGDAGDIHMQAAAELWRDPSSPHRQATQSLSRDSTNEWQSLRHNRVSATSSIISLHAPAASASLRRGSSTTVTAGHRASLDSLSRSLKVAPPFTPGQVTMSLNSPQSFGAPVADCFEGDTTLEAQACEALAIERARAHSNGSLDMTEFDSQHVMPVYNAANFRSGHQQTGSMPNLVENEDDFDDDKEEEEDCAITVAATGSSLGQYKLKTLGRSSNVPAPSVARVSADIIFASTLPSTNTKERRDCEGIHDFDLPPSANLAQRSASTLALEKHRPKPILPARTDSLVASTAASIKATSPRQLPVVSAFHQPSEADLLTLPLFENTTDDAVSSNADALDDPLLVPALESSESIQYSIDFAQLDDVETAEATDNHQHMHRQSASSSTRLAPLDNIEAPPSLVLMHSESTIALGYGTSTVSLATLEAIPAPPRIPSPLTNETPETRQRDRAQGVFLPDVITDEFFAARRTLKRNPNIPPSYFNDDDDDGTIARDNALPPELELEGDTDDDDDDDDDDGPVCEYTHVEPPVESSMGDTMRKNRAFLPSKSVTTTAVNAAMAAAAVARKKICSDEDLANSGEQQSGAFARIKRDGSVKKIRAAKRASIDQGVE